MANDQKHNYIIADEMRQVMSLDGIKVFGIRVSMPAIFDYEDQALEVLYAIQKAHPELPPHGVVRIETSLTVTVSTFDGATNA